MDTAPHETPVDPSSATASQQPPSQAVGHDHDHEMRLHRRRSGRMLGGVAAGLADYFDVDPVLIRIGFVVLAFVGGLGVPLYLAGWALVPDEETDTSIAEEILARERTRNAY